MSLGLVDERTLGRGTARSGASFPLESHASCNAVRMDLPVGRPHSAINVLHRSATIDGVKTGLSHSRFET